MANIDMESPSRAAQLRSEIETLKTEIRSLADKQDEWTPEQSSRWDEANKRYDAATVELGEAESRARDVARRIEQLQGDGSMRRQREPMARDNEAMERRFIDMVNNGRILDWGNSQRSIPYDPDFDFGRYALALRGITVGMTERELREFRAIDTTNATAIPTVWSRRLLDNLRAALVMVKAGGSMVVIPQGSLNFTNVMADPKASWLGELASDTPSSPTLDSVILNPNRLQTTVRISGEAFADSINASSAITQSTVGAQRVALDAAALNGSGSGAEPRGILNTPGIQTMTATGALSWDDISLAISMLQDANYGGTIAELAVVTTPPIAHALRVEKSGGGGDYMSGSSWTPQVRLYATSSMPDDTTIVGDFQHVFVGTRLQEIKWFDAGDVGGTNLVMSYALALRAVLRADVQVSKPDQFVAITSAGVKTKAKK